MKNLSHKDFYLCIHQVLTYSVPRQKVARYGITSRGNLPNGGKTTKRLAVQASPRTSFFRLLVGTGHAGRDQVIITTTELKLRFLLRLTHLCAPELQNHFQNHSEITKH